jgi:hypothetical protein
MSGGLRSFALLVGATPMLVVPILIGGVGPRQVGTTAIALAALVTLSLGAGLWASTRGRTPGTALARAYLALAVILLLVAGTVSGMDAVTASLMTPRWQVFLFRDAWLEICGVPDPELRYGKIFQAVAPPSPPKTFLGLAARALCLMTFSLMVAAFWIGRAKGELVRHAAAESQGRAESAMGRRFVRIPSVLVARHRRWRLGVLARNPLEWLARRTPRRALMRWFWLGVAGLVWAQLALSMNWMSYYDSGLSWNLFPWILTAAAIWSTATALREERRTGTLEMILVTGLTESQIVQSVLRTTRQDVPSCGAARGGGGWVSGGTRVSGGCADVSVVTRGDRVGFARHWTRVLAADAVARGLAGPHRVGFVGTSAAAAAHREGTDRGRSQLEGV